MVKECDCLLVLLQSISGGKFTVNSLLTNPDVSRRAQAIVDIAESLGCPEVLSKDALLEANYRQSFLLLANLFLLQ